jgi:hypothetical protein
MEIINETKFCPKNIKVRHQLKDLGTGRRRQEWILEKQGVTYSLNSTGSG